MSTDMKVLIGLGAGFAVLPVVALLVGLSETSSSPATPSSTSAAEGSRVPTVTVVQTSTRPPTPPHRFLESYMKNGKLRRNVLVAHDISDASLTVLARDLRDAHPVDTFNFVTDAAGFPRYKEWDLTYQQGNPTPIPTEWIRQHMRAYLGPISYGPRDFRWNLQRRGNWANEANDFVIAEIGRSTTSDY